VRAGISGLAVSNRGGLGRLSRIYLLALAQARPEWELHVFLRSTDDLLLLREECDQRRRPLVDQFICHYPVLPGLNRLLLEEVLLPAAFRRLSLDAYLGCDFTLPPTRLAPVECVVVPDLLPFSQSRTVSWRARWLYRRGLRRSLARKARLLFISEHGKASGQRLFGKLPPASRVIYPALSPRFEMLAKSAPPGDYALQVQGSLASLIDPGPYMLYVGSFESRKNVKLLTQSFVSLVMQGDYRGSLVLVGGDGRYHTAPRRQPLAMEVVGFPGGPAGKSAEINDIGRVSDTDLSQLYRHADLLVNLSTEEGFGFPVLEALAHGLPVVVTKDSSMAEIAQEGLVQIPLEPARCLNTLADAAGALPILRREAAGFETAQWTIERLGEQLAVALEEK